LTLEHLEDYFYHHFLDQFSADDFAKAGYPKWVRNRVEEIAMHEASHVALLSGALGQSATQACQYSFPGVTDPKSFMATAALIENVGVSAYLGAAKDISEPAYVTVAGSILTTEARHQGWENSAVLKAAAWSGPYDTPLDYDQVYSIVAPFITSCPSTNPTLPVKAFPAMTIGPDGTVTTSVSTEGAYVQVLSGLASGTYPVVNGKVQNLPNPQGISYAVLTSQSNTTMVTDDNILAGPVIRDSPFDSAQPNPAATF